MQKDVLACILSNIYFPSLPFGTHLQLSLLQQDEDGDLHKGTTMGLSMALLKHLHHYYGYDCVVYWYFTPLSK